MQSSKIISLVSKWRTVSMLLVVIWAPFISTSCGKSGGSGGSPSTMAVGAGALVSWPSTGEEVAIKPDGASLGQEFIILPFGTGDIEKLRGSTVEPYTLKVTASAALRSQYFDSALNAAADVDADQASPAASWQTIDHLRRSALNQFDASKGSDQNPRFWAALNSLERIQESGSRNGVKEGVAAPHAFTAYLNSGKASEAVSLNQNKPEVVATDCPTSNVIVPRWINATTPGTLAVDIDVSFDGTDYCLAILDGSTLVSEPDLNVLKGSVKEIMRRYKEVIYQDAFTANVKGGYAFKPLIVIADFSDAVIWPDPNVSDPDLKAQNMTYQVAGAFLSDFTTSLKRPVIYMASNLAKVKGAEGTSAELARKTFHATLAHEMQHAVTDYYRSRGSVSVGETLFLDEGVAHYMEDLFGYGEVSFDGFPKAFLASFADGIFPFLGDSEDSKGLRGGAQSLIYYLVSQKGGVAFTGGNFTAGDGLAAVAKLVKNTSAGGAKNLSAAFGGDWPTVVGGFLAALTLDGSTVQSTEGAFRTQAPVEGIRDLQGNANKKYGMRFNGFGGLADRLASYEKATSADLSTDGREIRYYQTLPLLWAPKKAGDSIGLSLEGMSGRHAQVIRIK